MKPEAHVREETIRCTNKSGDMRPVRDAEEGFCHDPGGVGGVGGGVQEGLEGVVLGVPVGHLLLAQPPPYGILVQLLMGRNLMLLCTVQKCVIQQCDAPVYSSAMCNSAF